MLKKGTLFVILIFFIMAVGAVSAHENPVGNVTDSNDGIQLDVPDKLTDSDNDDKLADPDVGSFDELDNLIYDSYYTLKLTKDYKKLDSDSVSAEGIIIDEKLTIDGDGHTIDASNLGRIFKLDGAPVVLKNLKLINAHFDGNGGAIYGFASSLTIDNCTFINNSAKNGGAYFTDEYSGLQPLINNSYFENNTAEESGGAIHADFYGFRVYNSVFVNNAANYKPEEYSTFARYGGGAIYSKFWAMFSYIDNSTFINNTANYLGGAVNVQSGANSQDAVYITNSRFEGNTATSSGAVYLATRFSDVDNCNFTGNHANETGGALGVYNYYESITNSRFENNSAGRDGGAVFSFAPYYHINSIDNSVFINNSAGTYGGAVNAISTDITNSIFADNSAGDYAGAVATYGSNVKDSAFSNNNAPDGTVLVMNDGSDINAASSSQSNNGLSDDEVSTDYTDRGIISPRDGYPANVVWSDLGYVGFCCEKFYSQPYSGVVDHTLNVIDNNINGKPVGEYLKILLYTYFDGYNDFFNYYFPDYIWEFTDYDYEHSDKEIVRNVVELYNSGFRVPTENALKVLDNGDILRMDFLALDTADGEQDIFLFNWDTVTADLKKESLNKTTFIGEKIDFKITVKNTGDAILSNITVDDSEFSKELIYVDYRIGSGNWTYDSHEKVWKVADLKSGETAVLILTFKSTTNGTFQNNATLKTKDIVLDKVNETTDVYTPQLFTKKISLNSTVYNGQIAEFLISLKNTGDYPLSNVFVEDIADEGLVYRGYVNGSRKWDYRNGKFYLTGTLAPDEVANFTVLFETTKSGNFTNTATGGSDETENHTWEDTVEVFSPKMSVKKISLNDKLFIGQIAVFVISVNNTGDCMLSNVSVEEIPGDGLAYVGYVNGSRQWNYKEGKFNLVGSLDINETANFTVLFEVIKSGNLTNVAVAVSDETGKGSGDIPRDETDEDTVEAFSPELSVQKITLNETVNIGQIVQFRIVVANVGDCNVSGIVIEEDAPGELVYVGYMSDVVKLSYRDGKFLYDGTLAVGDAFEFIVLFNATKVGNFTNAIRVSSNETKEVNASNSTIVEEEKDDSDDVTQDDGSQDERDGVPDGGSHDDSKIEPDSTDKPENAESIISDKNVTGNPLSILMMVILSCGLMPLGRKK